MHSEIIFAAYVALASILAGALTFLAQERGLLDRIGRLFGAQEPSQETYSERLEDVTRRLMKSSSEVDTLLGEMARITKAREQELHRMECQLSQSQEEERSLEERIDALRDTPLPVAEHFARMIERGEKRTAGRDYILFGAGVLVSTVVAIALRLAGLG